MCGCVLRCIQTKQREIFFLCWYNLCKMHYVQLSHDCARIICFAVEFLLSRFVCPCPFTLVHFHSLINLLELFRLELAWNYIYTWNDQINDLDVRIILIMGNCIFIGKKGFLSNRWKERNHFTCWWRNVSKESGRCIPLNWN